MMTNIEAFQETVICKRIDCRNTPHQVALQGRTLAVIAIASTLFGTYVLMVGRCGNANVMAQQQNLTLLEGW